MTVPAAEGRLLRVGVDDVRRVQLPWSAASLSAGERRQEGQASDPPSPAVQPVGAEESGGDCYGEDCPNQCMPSICLRALPFLRPS